MKQPPFQIVEVKLHSRSIYRTQKAPNPTVCSLLCLPAHMLMPDIGKDTSPHSSFLSSGFVLPRKSPTSCI